MGQGLVTIEDFLMAGKPVGLDELIGCAEQERSSWEVGKMPPTTTLRYIILAMDFAAREPKRWRTFRARYALPDLTLEELAIYLGITRQTVARHLQPVRLAETDEFFNRDLMPEQ